jgi:hypothetical protein
MKRLLALPVLVLLMISCASSSEETRPATAAESIRVTVRNDGVLDATVYLVHGGSRRRLGLVNAHSEQTFTVPRSLASGLTELRFAIDWIGRRDNPTSESIVAQPGDHIQLIIR